MDNWFSVDRRGLAKLVERKGKAFVLFELLQNSLDTDARNVEVCLEPLAGRPAALLIVRDDNPDGFKDLTHAFTLFAESEKKSDPTKRGRFNLGEKLVLALCDEARITSTRGSVIFEGGERRRSSSKTEAGTEFRATIRMTRAEIEQVEREIGSVLVPSGVLVTFNGRVLEPRSPLAEVEASLATMTADAEGNLTRTKRKTTIRIFEPREGETATIYEMGIPIVETGDRYHVDVAQKVPLTMERDNVPPAFLRDVRAAVAGVTAARLTRAVPALAQAHEVSERTIRRYLDQIEGLGLEASNPGPRESYLYRIASPAVVGAAS